MVVVIWSVHWRALNTPIHTMTCESRCKTSYVDIKNKSFKLSRSAFEGETVIFTLLYIILRHYYYGINVLLHLSIDCLVCKNSEIARNAMVG